MKKLTNKNKIDLGNTPVKKVFWIYAIPSILAILSQNTAALIDSIFIGRYVGPEGLSAIALTMPFMGVLFGIGFTLAIGGTTLAGIELGKGNHSESNNYFNLTTLLLFLSGLFAITMVALFIDKMTLLVGASGVTKIYMAEYTRTISFFFMFFLLNFAFSYFLKLEGKPFMVVLITMSGTILNILLDYIFIVKLNYSIKGAAYATGISQLIPWLFLFAMIQLKSSWTIKKPIIRLKSIWRILFNGSSEFLSNTSVSISGFIFNLIIMKNIGVLGVAGYAVVLQIAHLAATLNYGFAESNQAGVSYNYGAMKYDRVNAFLKMALKTNLVTGLLLFIVSISLGEQIASTFVSNDYTISITANILKFYGIAFILSGMNITFGTYYTAIDEPVLSGFIMLFRSLIALMIGLVILPPLLGDSGIWASIIFAELATFALGVILLIKRPLGLKIIQDNLTAKELLKSA
jgi:putative MATE family efflux protein